MGAAGFLAKLLQTQLPGGVPLLDAVATGLYYGTRGQFQTDEKIEVVIGDNGFGSLPRVESVGLVRSPSVVMTQAQLLQMQLNVARSVPHAINHNVRGAPGAALAVLRPVQQLGRQISSFRGAPLPRVTGLEGLPTLSEMVADALEGTRVGTYTPPNPKLPGGRLSDWLIAGAIGTLLGRASVALLGQWGQFWGGKNSRELIYQPGTWADSEGVPMILRQPSTLVVQATTAGTVTHTNCNDGTPAGGQNFSNSNSYTYTNVTRFTVTGASGGVVESPCGSGSNVLTRQATWEIQLGNGQTQPGSGPGEAFGSVVWWRSVAETQVSLSFEVVGDGPYPPPPVLVPGGQTTPNPVEVDRSSPPAPGPLAPLPLPSAPESPAVPDAPAVSPGPQPAPGQTPSQPTYPSVAPSRPATPLPAPGVPPLPGDGSGLRPQPQPTPTTPPGVVIPWPGAPPVGGPGQAPAPTLTGIAQEVGRIERKLDSIMAPRPAGPSGEPGNWQNQLDDLWDWLERFEPGGSYELRGVCEVDANGEPVETVVEHPWPSGLGSNLGVTGRLDAIAAMLQTHKELRQPICRNPKPQGEPVTVQFEEL